MRLTPCVAFRALQLHKTVHPQMKTLKQNTIDLALSAGGLALSAGSFLYENRKTIGLAVGVIVATAAAIGAVIFTMRDETEPRTIDVAAEVIE